MKSIFLVKSPLQLLNAIEARHHFNLKLEDCILVLMSDRKSTPQMHKLISQGQMQWGRVLALNELSASIRSVKQLLLAPVGNHRKGAVRFQGRSFLNIWRLNTLAAALKSVDYVVIGDYRNLYMRHFMNVVNSKTQLLLDDGTATFQIAEQRNTGQESDRNISTRKRIKLWLKRAVQGLRDESVKQLCFFSAYNIEIRSPDRLDKNDFSYLRKAGAEVEQDDRVYLVGSPIPEAGIMTENEYLNHVRKVKQYYQKRVLVYIAHRRESAAKLKRIEKQLEIPVRHFEYPLEYQFALIGPRPTEMASFYSTALDNCRMIFGDSMNIIAFRLMGSGYKNQTTIDAVYDYLSTRCNDHFRVISLTDRLSSLPFRNITRSE